MSRIYFFQKRNTATGEILKEYLDADERTAWDYLNVPRHYKYIGWSDGRFMKEIAKERLDPGRDARGISLQPSEGIKDKIREAQKKELDFAISNPDKTKPRNLTKSYLRNSDRESLEGTAWDKMKM